MFKKIFNFLGLTFNFLLAKNDNFNYIPLYLVGESIGRQWLLESIGINYKIIVSNYKENLDENLLNYKNNIKEFSSKFSL